MIQSKFGLISLIFTWERSKFQLCLGLFLCLFWADLSSEVKLKGVSVEPGIPGQWTVARVRIQNTDEDLKELELRWTMGSIETSVSEQKMKFNLPGESIRMVWAPVWIPSDILSKAKQASANNKKKRSFVNLSVQLFENGALKSRETALGTIEDTSIMRGMNLGRNRDKNHVYDPLAEMRPTEGAVLPEVVGWGKNRWSYKQRADEIQGYSYLFPDLLDRKSIFWIQKGYDPQQGLWSVLNWVERGGLLIIDPMNQDELGPLAAILGIQIGDEVWSSPKKALWKMEGDRALIGRELQTDRTWQSVMAEQGVQVAAKRDWGLGQVAMLNYRWNALVGKDRDRAKKILEDLHPKSFANEFESNYWKEDAKTSLIMRHGNRIWSRETVMVYLGSLMFFSLVLWLVPFFSHRKELRWGLWTVGMLAWTGGGLAIFLNKASAGAKFSSEIISYGKAGGEVEKLRAYSAFYSESLRKFPLAFEDGVDVKRETKVKSSSMQKTSNTVSFEDFSLQPMRLNLLNWNRTKATSLPEVELYWSDKLELKLPKELLGKNIALVMGRKIWEGQAAAQTNFKLEDGRLIREDENATALFHTAFRLSKQASSNRGSLGSQRSWLLYQANTAAPFSFPKDIERNETHVRVLEVKPQYREGNFALSSGMSEWYFRRGKGVKTWKSNDLGFDGLQFRTENVNMSLGWRFELPQNIRNKVKASEISLNLSEVPESVSKNMLYVYVKGKRQKLNVMNNSVKLPLEAMQNGIVEIEVQPPMPKIGASAMMRPPWKPWVEGLEMKGKLQ